MTICGDYPLTPEADGPRRPISGVTGKMGTDTELAAGTPYKTGTGISVYLVDSGETGAALQTPP